MESSDQAELARASIGALKFLRLVNRWKESRPKKRQRQYYVRPMNLQRPIQSEFHSFVNDLLIYSDTKSHKEYFRMSEENLHHLLRKVGPALAHQPTHAMPISPAFRLAFTLKILGSGDSINVSAMTYRIGYKTALNIIYETCDAIWNILQPEYIPFPTADDWKTVTQEFWKRWNFPLCLGALDGKHVVIKMPANEGSNYFNYKLDHSIVLLALANANYRFLYVDIGQYGRCSDGGVFASSSLGRAMCDDATNPLKIPGFHRLPGTAIICPHVMVADNAFAEGPNMVIPFGGTRRSPAQRRFDKRLSRARGVVENAFGILAARFQILHKPIGASPENATRIVRAIVVLHNFLTATDAAMRSSNNLYMPPHMIDYFDEASGEIREGEWRHQVPADCALRRLASRKNRSEYGKAVRDRLMAFFQTAAGSVPWE